MDLLILGASARAAAHSARRAGLSPAAIDLFADRDLAALGPIARLNPTAYPAGLEAHAATFPPVPWLYTGALENHPDLVDRISRTRPLWGVGGEGLRGVRDPSAVASALRRAGLPAPAVRRRPEGLPRDGSWLVKPLASAGGRGIRPLGLDRIEARQRVWFQERIEGPSLSALYLGRGGRAELLGLTRQWIGRPGTPFAYVGSVGPVPVAEPVGRRVAALGDALARAFGLLGLFGVDLILRDGWPWPVEVNPRYTASVEVLELATGRPLLAAHRRAFDRAAPPVPDAPDPHPGVVGKAILFADESCTLSGPIRLPTPVPFAVPPIADVPPAGARFAAGEPVLTVFARAGDPDACFARLGRHLARWRRRLRPGDGIEVADTPLP